MADDNATRNGTRYRDIWILLGVLLGGTGSIASGVGLYSTTERFYRTDGIRLEDRLTQQIRDLHAELDRNEREILRVLTLLPPPDLEARLRSLEIRIGNREDQ